MQVHIKTMQATLMSMMQKSTDTYQKNGFAFDKKQYQSADLQKFHPGMLRISEFKCLI